MDSNHWSLAYQTSALPTKLQAQFIKSYLSTSPKTISNVPITVTKSAIICPEII